MKRIAIDVSPLNDCNSTRGVGHYTSRLVDALQIQLKTNSEYKNKYRLDLVTDNSRPLAVYDLVHYPYFDPFFLTLPPKSVHRRVVTVHDLIPREYPSHFPVGFKGEIKWLIQKHRLRQSDYLITPSHYSKNVISDILNYPSDRIFVTYEAADNSYHPRPADELLPIKNKYHLPDKFVLFVGDINWNKNLPALVKSCLELGYSLVLVGSAAVKQPVPDHPWTADLRLVQKLSLQHPELIIRPGFVPDNELPLFYNLATIYCQPSFAEGFGLPLVAAMQSGTAVAYSESSCLNEIMDYNGEMFEPTNGASIKQALSTLWTQPSLRCRYSRQGITRAKIFSWKFTALQTLGVYDLCFIS